MHPWDEWVFSREIKDHYKITVARQPATICITVFQQCLLPILSDKSLELEALIKKAPKECICEVRNIWNTCLNCTHASIQWAQVTHSKLWSFPYQGALIDFGCCISCIQWVIKEINNIESRNLLLNQFYVSLFLDFLVELILFKHFA